MQDWVSTESRQVAVTVAYLRLQQSQVWYIEVRENLQDDFICKGQDREDAWGLHSKGKNRNEKEYWWGIIDA